MNDKLKIKRQAEDIKKAGEMIKHLTELVLVSTQALRYIASPPEKKSAIILLKSYGLPQPESDGKQPAEEVANECLSYMVDIRNAFIKKPDLRVVDGPEEVRLSDGDEIVFSTDFDILYHQCCSCGHTHSIMLLWEEIDGNPVLRTKWTTVNDLPTEASILAGGGKILRAKHGKNKGSDGESVQ